MSKLQNFETYLSRTQKKSSPADSFNAYVNRKSSTGTSNGPGDGENFSDYIARRKREQEKIDAKRAETAAKKEAVRPSAETEKPSIDTQKQASALEWQRKRAEEYSKKQAETVGIPTVQQPKQESAVKTSPSRGETRRNNAEGNLYTAVPAKRVGYADSSKLGGTLKETSTNKETPVQNTVPETQNSNFFDNLLARAKYIGESGKVGFESGVDALKNTGKTFASSISEFLETLFPGKEVGDSGIKLPTFRTNRHATLTTYADSAKNGLEQGSTSAVDAAAKAHKDELIRNLNEYANTNTRQKKMEELQAKYSDEDIGIVTQVLADGANSIGYNLPSQAVNLITGGLGGAVVMGTQAFGDAYSDAKNGGASNRDALEYAAKEAINQGTLDTLFGAFGDSIIGSKVSKAGAKITKPVARSLFEVGTNAVGEGVEEVLQSLVSTANQRATYDPEATVDPSALAYEGLLGGLMGGFYGALSLPGKIKTNKVDYDLVNQYSRRAAQVTTDADAETVVRVGNAIIDSADEVINNKDSSTEDIARAVYIKNGVTKTMSILEGYKDRIIIDNNERSGIVSDIVNKPVSEINTNIARLVDKVAESIEPGDDAVNRTVDYLRGEIMARDYAIHMAATPDGRRINELERRALVEIDKTLRSKRAEIEAARAALPKPAESVSKRSRFADAVESLYSDEGDVKSKLIEFVSAAAEKLPEGTDIIQSALNYLERKGSEKIQTAGTAQTTEEKARLEQESNRLIDAYSVLYENGPSIRAAVLGETTETPETTLETPAAESAEPDIVTRLAESLAVDTAEAEAILSEARQAAENADSSDRDAYRSDVQNAVREAVAERYGSSPKTDDEIGAGYRDLYDKIRTTTIKIPENAKTEIDEWSKWRRGTLGKLKLSNTDGLPIDTFWQGLSANNPELFDPALTSETEMLTRLLEVSDTLRGKVRGTDEKAERTAEDERSIDEITETVISSISDVVESRAEQLTESPDIDTMEGTTESGQNPDNSDRVEETAPAIRDFSLTYKQTKHTKTGEPLNVFSTTGKLSKDEYASLKSKMKEIGGYWSSYVKGFIVPADKVDAVSEFADITSDIPKIYSGMSEEERAGILRNSILHITEYTGNDAISQEVVFGLQNSYVKAASKIIKELGDKFKVFRKYSNENILLDFEYSKSSLKESVHKQGDISTDFSDFAKMLVVFEDVVKNAVPIEVHTDKYVGTARENVNLKQDYVLLSGFSDGEYIIPVEFNIKEFKETVGDPHKLYVSITLGKIKKEDAIMTHLPDDSTEPQTSHAPSSSEISIPQLISKINPEYGNFFKYIPSEFLTKEQLTAKEQAISAENERLASMREDNKKTTSIADNAEASPTRTAAGNDVNTLSEENQTPAPVSGRSDSIVSQPSGNVNEEVSARSDEHQAMAEGVIPSVAPQATTSAPDADGMQTETVSADSLVNSFYSEIADRIVADYLDTGAVLSINDLQKIATTIYKGTLAEGAFSVKDMTDALELAVNRHIIKQMSDNAEQYNADTAESAVKGIEWAEGVLKQIPTQTKRTDEQISLQQFSTPPNIAYLANWIANINDTDFMLEPSAGIGGLASFAKGFGAATAVNEISERRLGALRSLGFDHVFSEDAAQLDNILPDFVKPTVVVMNPPFSSTGGRTKNSTANAKPHVEQALARLENGGRLVAILGQGMSNDAPMFAGWWDEIRKNYNIRANIGIDGSNYRKYGTTFNVRLVVIDKTGPQNGETITGDFKSLNDIPKLMEGVRNDRTHTGTTESNSAVAGGERPSGGTRSVPEAGRTVSGAVSPDNAADVAGDNAVGRRVSSDSGRSVRSESAADERGGTDTGTAVPGNDEQQSGGRSVSSGTDESVADVAQSEPGSRTGGSDVGGRRTSDNDLSADGGQSGNAEVGRTGGRDGRITETPETAPKKAAPKAQKKKANTSDDGIYAGYVPSKLAIKGAKPHPAVLVESSAMAAVAAPEITYAPKIAQDVIDKGLISDVQLENISYAGQAHEQLLDNGTRKGYFIGDGTGVGKGRQAAGIILDNFNQGRRKAVWISEKAPLMEDAKRDWGDIGGNPDDIFDIDGIRKGVGKGKNKKVPEEGILFVPYSTVRSGKSADKKTTNADAIIQWLGKDFDGVIIYDEAHNMNSLIPSSGSRGMKKAAQQAIEANKIQEALPNARVVYMSATGATEVKDLCFASRLGLWGKGTQFMNAEDFSSKIGASGVAGMELVASSLKSMGVYQARSISFEGVRYDSVRHKLTKQQRQMYDTMSEAWQITLQNMEMAIKATGVKNAGTARSIFYSTMQNFYNQVLSSMATPSVIEDIKKELAAGHSCVIQLINTNEAQQEKELSKAKAEERDLEELDITPRGALLGFLENSFPVQQYEKYLDEHGNENSRPVYDSKGKPVLNKQAVAARDNLIARINEMSIPDGPIDMILNAFGADNVAEVTGRSRRVVSKPDENGNMRKVEENLKADFRIAETTAFQNGEKRILIFSNAGSTGRSYHADKRAKNQQQRIHYILQPGWNAKTATQGFGRTHRSNQVHTPVYKLVQTDIEGQKRFVTSIARRLDQLGALTKGQRQTGSGIFGEKDNLESKTSIDALREFYNRLGKEKIPGVNGRDVFTKLGLYRNFYDEYGNFTLKSDKAFDITTFLNRLLALKVDEQNIVFGEFESIRQQMYDIAIENGTLDTGIYTVKADKITVNQEETIYTDEKTGAETKYVKATAYTKATVIQTVDDAIALRGQFQGLRRMKDGSVRAVYRAKDETDPLGRVHKKYLLQSPNREKKSSYRESTLLADSQEIPKSEWEKAWAEELKNVPEYNESTLHFITGAILTVWNKLPQDGNIKAIKIVTDDGSQLLGRIIPSDRIDSVLRGMDIKQKKEHLTGRQLYDAIMKSGKEAVFAPSYSGRNTIKRSRVAGENRLEITGTNLWSLQSDYPDIISETIQYQRRYFIPTGEKGIDILNSILSYNTVKLESKDETSMFYSNVEGKWGKGDKNGKKLKSVSDLQREATRIFGVQINTGKVGGGAAGVYKTHAHTIRTRVYGDLPTIAHELGHWFDQRYHIADSDAVNELVDLYRDEMEAADYHESVYPYEAVAMYFADLFRDKEEARTKAPDFSDWLDSTLSKTDKKRLTEYTDMVNEYHAADTMRRRNEQVHFRHKDHSALGEAQMQLDALLTNPAAYMGSLGKKFIRSWFDDIVDLKPYDKTYDLAMKERAANSIASGRLNIAFTDNQGNVIGRSLAAILHEGGINDINHKDFNAYLIARVALDRIEAAEDGENVATLVYADAELQNKDSIIEAIRTYERDNPTFADAASGVYEYRNNLLDVAVDSGIISEGLANYFKETFPHYVPLYRVMDDKSSVSSGRGKKTPKAPIGRFKGSGRDIYAPIENLAIQTSVFTKAILQNETRRAFADYIDSHEDMGWAAERVPEGKVFDVVSTDEIGYRLSQFDSDKFADMTAEQKAELFEEVMGFVGSTTGMWKAKTKQDENVISVLRDGQRMYYEIHDKNLMDAMLTMTPKEYGVILSTMGKLTAGFKVLTTGSNPRFGMTNVPRDVQSGFISSRTTINPIKYGFDFVGAFVGAIAETDGYKEYLRNGGGYQGALTMDMRNLKHEYRDLVQSTSKMKNFIRSAVGMIPRLIDAGESASRYAEFRRARKQGIDALEALRKSQEITVNFQRHGKVSAEIDKVIPYFNASLQSLYHYYDVLFKGKPKEKAGAWTKFIGSNLTMSAMILVWNYVLAPQLFDDEEKPEESYENLSAYNKNAYWCFYTGNGEFLRIAKPKDMMVPSTVISNMFELQVRENPSAFYDYAGYLADVFFPPAASDATIIGTALSLAKNETFTGAPIVSTAYQNLAPELQYNEKTSKLGIALGSVLGLSPMQIDYVLDDTTGFVGDFILNLTQQDGVKVQDILDLDDKGMPNVLTADSVYSTDIVSIFYDTKAKYDTGKASYKATGGTNDKYTAYDAYGSYKYDKVADLYSAANKIIKTDGNEESARKARAALNALVKSVNETEVTDIDTAVSKIAEESGYAIGDIAPYIVVPESVKDSEKNVYNMDAYDMMEYYTESQVLFEAVYPKLIESGYDAVTIAEAMKQVKKEFKKQMDARYAEIKRNR